MDKIELLGLPMELSQLYFEQLGEPSSQSVSVGEVSPPKQKKEVTEQHQCPNCLTIYDSRYGDEFNGIEAGTSFVQLPATYICPTCTTPKSEFQSIDNQLVMA